MDEYFDMIGSGMLSKVTKLNILIIIYFYLLLVTCASTILFFTERNSLSVFHRCMRNWFPKCTRHILQDADNLKRHLGAFAKLRKATVSFVMSVYRTTRLPLDGFSSKFYFRIFRKSVEKIQI
jgi:hypothetical protein